MGILECFYHPLPTKFLQKSIQAHVSTSNLRVYAAKRSNLISTKIPNISPLSSSQSSKALAMISIGAAAGLTLFTFAGSSYAADSSIFSEPSNALSLPTWAIHVSSVVEWITAMALVWQYGEKSGYESWKGLSWGMLCRFLCSVEHFALVHGISFTMRSPWRFWWLFKQH
ncbi:uncharacterized protein LOC127243150 isoform X2 [Andrographis paniculata]|uniref:uncharacterized protein LOC127243150 isoform X2 n=1 Tax=Andrographis paniculata TaxID=175694 RepID=UPI0021E8823E|nr:uncharacterized protein LOC127243150 isoform X2 [Andrographis paniculata]